MASRWPTGHQVLTGLLQAPGSEEVAEWGVCVYTRACPCVCEENRGLTDQGLCLALRGEKKTLNESTRIKRQIEAN